MVQPSQEEWFAAATRAAVELPEGFEHVPRFFDAAASKAIFSELRSSVVWRQDHASFFGKRVALPRLTAWYGDPGASYGYSGIVNEPLPWTAMLARLRVALEQRAGARFNSVLLNLYRDGSDRMGWHRDNERELGSTPTIASLSFGATRRFRLREQRTRESIDLELASGALLVMRQCSQRDWAHCVPASKQVQGARINATFRWVRSRL